MTCEKCFSGRHLRCENKTGCGCNVCARAFRRATRTRKPDRSPLNPTEFRLRKSERMKQKRHAAYPGDPRLAELSNVPDLVLELMKAIRESVRGNR